MRQEWGVRVLATALALIGALPAGAQFSQGRLTGVVRDESGAPVPGAILSIQDQDTGVTRTLTTSARGTYAAADLRPGPYRVRVELAGFAAAAEKVRLNAGTTIALDFVLQLAAVPENLVAPHEAVTVVGEAGLVDTAQSQVAEVIQRETIGALPLNGRFFLELAFLVPGNSPTANYDPTKGKVVEVSSVGQLGRGGNVSVDGVDNNDDVVGGVLQNFSLDAVQEFQVVTNRYSAEIGRSASSVINVVTRSGSNELHGSGSVFHRSSGLTADNPLVPQTPGVGFDRQQYSAALGGPLRKDRAFWFLSYEHTHEDGAAIAGTRNLEAHTIDPSYVAAPFRDNLLLLRLDWQARPADRLFLRYSRQKNDITDQGSLRRPIGDAFNLQVAKNRIDAAVVGWTHLFGPSLVNSARVHYNDFANTVDPIAGAPAPGIRFPDIQTGANFRVPQSTTQKRLEIKDDLNWARGRHALKAGIDLQPLISSEVTFDLFGAGVAFASENFATADRNHDGVSDDRDIPVSFTLVGTSPTVPRGAPPDNQYLGLYAQDDWRLRDNLTLNLGLRWEMDFNVKNLSLQSPFPPVQERTRETDNFAPRLGFAWDPWKNGRSVIRGGYGIYYDRIVLEVPLLEQLLDGQTLPVASLLATSLADPLCQQTPCGRTSIALGRNVLANDLRTPQNQQFSLGFERRLGKEYVVSVDGLINKGRNYILAPEVNKPRDAEPFVNPEIQEVVQQFENVARTEYKGLLVTAQRRLTRGLGFLASYTLSRSKNYSNDDQIPFNGGNPEDPLAVDKEFSWSNIDERHRFVLSGTWEAPLGIRVAPIVTLSSGVPFDIRQNTNFVGYDNGAGDFRFPLVGRNAGGREVETGADLNLLIDQFNTDPQNAALLALRGRPFAHVDPGLDLTHPFRTVDLRVSKVVKVRRADIEILAEVFNLFDGGGTTFVDASGQAHHINVRGFNNVGYAGVGINMESAQFGQPLATAGGAFGSGGPRALQLGVRVVF